MLAMVEREAGYRLCDDIQVDDAYLGGKLNDGAGGRGSEGKLSFVATVSLDGDGQPQHGKFAQLPVFTRQAIAEWA
jgi:hypothetical protein